MPEEELVTDPSPVVGTTTGGISYGVAKAALARVVDNGVCADEQRVMDRLNEATKALMDEVIGVGMMATYDVRAQGITLILPPELENAIEVEVLDGGKVRGSTDVAAGWYDLVNPFTYVHPNAAHDNPLVDQFMYADPDDQTILRRMYDYPGLEMDSLVRVTGAKRFRPVTSDDDFLIIQNLWALKLMIMAIERIENGKLDEWKVMKDEAIAVLTAEVKKHQLDPTNVLKRKAAYDSDLATFSPGTYGYTRALLAHMLPGGLMMGKSELSRVLDMSEMRLMNKGQWVGTLESFEAQIEEGQIAMPARVHSVVAADMPGCCESLDIRSILYSYKTNGYWWCSDDVLEDLGEVRFGENFRRVYRLRGNYNLPSSTEYPFNFRFVGKLRWWKKAPTEYMSIRNTEAHRLMIMCVLTEENGKDGGPMEQKAILELERELREYMSGIHNQLTIVHDEGYAHVTGRIL